VEPRNLIVKQRRRFLRSGRNDKIIVLSRTKSFFAKQRRRSLDFASLRSRWQFFVIPHPVKCCWTAWQSRI